MIISTTRTIAQLPHLAVFLADSPNAVAGWGRKPSGRRAAWLSAMLRRPLVLLEDGFVRSVERHAPPLSLLIDDIGIYYDATRPSGMERAISRGTNADQALRARALTAQWRDRGISKYNHAADYAEALPDRYVLVVDQTFGDLSVSCGLAGTESFTTMLDAALSENPNDLILVKVHPDIHSKAKKGYFPREALSHPRIRVIGIDCHCATLIRDATAVYCVTSLMGFEAMLWDRPVRCFGMPFYAGWGLTQDELPRPTRRDHAALHDIVYASLIEIARYVDPAHGIALTAEQAIDHVSKGRAALLSSHPNSRPV